jgi:dethiobiotin synthetase
MTRATPLSPPSRPAYVLVTGTSTGVGKTIATAAMAVELSRAGLRVGVVKPVQTGTGGTEPSDASVVRSLTDLDHVCELASMPDPLAPDTAARLRGTTTTTVAELAEQIAAGSADLDVVLVEGSGGVLVRLDTDGGTLLDLGAALLRWDFAVTAVIVTTLSLGTLNHTELTARALAAAGLKTEGLVVGSTPTELGLAETCNRTELPRVTGLRVLAELPAGAGSLAPEAFRAAARGWFDGLADAVTQSAAQR